MDRFDERILHELKTDGRISNVELAERIGLSASATLRRVQELEKKGVIKGYRAMLNSVELGIGFIAYVSIGLSSHSKHRKRLKSTCVMSMKWSNATTSQERTNTCSGSKPKTYRATKNSMRTY